MYIDLYKIEISAAQFNNDHLRSEITKLREQVKDMKWL